MTKQASSKPDVTKDGKTRVAATFEGSQADWKFTGIRIPEELWERFEAAALVEGREQGRPASVASILRKSMLRGLEAWELEHQDAVKPS